MGALPPAIVNSLATREITDQDYELLMQLESRTSANAAAGTENAANYSQIPEKVIKSWAQERVRENSQLLNPGNQCRVCLRAYQVNQLVRKLPGCKHKFHVECIDNWLLHSHPTCPIDGLVVWDPVTAQLEKEENMSNKHSAKSGKDSTKGSPNSNAQINSVVQHFPSLDMIINYKKYVIENRLPKNEAPPTGEIKVLGKKSGSSQRSSATSSSNKELAPLNRNATMLDCRINGQRPSNISVFKVEDSIINPQPLTSSQATTSSEVAAPRTLEESMGITASGLVTTTLPPKKNGLGNITGKLKAIQARAKAVDEAMLINKVPEPVSIPTRSTMRLKQLPMIEVTGKKVATTTGASADKQPIESFGFDCRQMTTPNLDVYSAAMFLDTKRPYQLCRAPSKSNLMPSASAPKPGTSLTQPCNSLAIENPDRNSS